MFASLAGKNGRVIAFEPAPITYSYLVDNVQRNGFTNVQVINKAIGDCVENRPIYYEDSDLAEETASLKYPDGRTADKMVEVDTLDNLISELPAPDWIKIDVEGYQTEVLRGGYRFLTTHHPIIMVELKDSADANQNMLDELRTEITDLGYRVYEIKKYLLKGCSNLDKATGRNFLLVNEDSPYFSRALRCL